MTTRRAIISGASIAGLSTAFWLHRTGWEVTILEKAAQFRDGGQNVDLRGVARDVLERMDLFDTVKALNTEETGTVIVDEAGAVVATMPDLDGAGATAELEVLRGDLARALLDALPSTVEIGFDETISAVTDDGSGVIVVTASGRELHADLLVVAEGVRSSTRELVVDGAAVHTRSLGVTMAFGTIPRTPDDDDTWRWYTATGGRQVHLRPDNHGTTRAILAFTEGEGDAEDLEPGEALARARRRFAGVGWQAPRVVRELERSDDVYVDHLTQVRVPTWRHGRSVLVGDAAWCVTPLGGGGASLALTSGYVLAAQLQAHPDDHTAGLAAWEAWMRPVVDDVQAVPQAMIRIAYPRTRVGLAANRAFNRLLTSRVMEPVAKRFTDVAQTDQELPTLVGAPND